MIPASTEDPLYYLHNFRQVLEWVAARHDDLLIDEERSWLADFSALPQPSQALLVRLVMRKGEDFRRGALSYAEIGCIASAAAPLLALGWLVDDRALDLAGLFAVLRKPELLARFGPWIGQRSARKEQWLAQLSLEFGQALPLGQWCPELDDVLYSVRVRALVDRLRLLFFGNLNQDWSEFVLADLGLYRYEQVDFPADARALRHRADLERALALHRCAEAMASGDALEPCMALLLEPGGDNAWLERRRHRLLFELAHGLERAGEERLALALYGQCLHPQARVRQIRVLERAGHFEEARALARVAMDEPRNAEESQHLARILPRLHRQLGLAALPKAIRPDIDTVVLTLSPGEHSVEWCVREHLHTEDAPVFYVENGLLNSLFGLLCWPALFAPLPGAFFHPFQSGPADLHQPDFLARRAALFDACLAELDDGRWQASIRQRYRDKAGLMSPFVHWTLLDDTLLELALSCLPAAHLKAVFERLLTDIRGNRAGLPDLIRFFPAEGAYQMIEVKGPGDRLQDNQLRWMGFCAEQGLPVQVCHVRWTTEA